MKRHSKKIVAGLIIVVTAVVVAYVSTWGLSLYINNQYAALHEGCQPNQANHEVIIKDEAAKPEHVTAARCDTLTITNLDDTGRLMAFGVHDHHVAYDGIKEKFLKKGESLTVTLVQTGIFLVHDHDDESIGSSFQVK